MLLNNKVAHNTINLESLTPTVAFTSYTSASIMPLQLNVKKTEGGKPGKVYYPYVTPTKINPSDEMAGLLQWEELS